MTSDGRASWARRRRRATALGERTPHAAEMLAFYASLLEMQERQADRLAAIPSTDSTTDVVFTGLLDALTACGSATDVIRSSARTLRGASGSLREALVRRLVAREPLRPIAGTVSIGEPELRFLGLAAAQVLAERSHPSRPTDPTDPTCSPQPTHPTRSPPPIRPTDPADSARRCPSCGWPPGVAVLEDAAAGDVKGGRSLECGLCGRTWRFARVGCPACGELRPAELSTHVDETIRHVRVDGCRTCHSYLKTVDLRIDGRAVPVVDEIATVELDVWARDQGLAKLEPNVLGV